MHAITPARPTCAKWCNGTHDTDEWEQGGAVVCESSPHAGRIVVDRAAWPDGTIEAPMFTLIRDQGRPLSVAEATELAAALLAATNSATQ